MHGPAVEGGGAAPCSASFNLGPNTVDAESIETKYSNSPPRNCSFLSFILCSSQTDADRP